MIIMSNNKITISFENMSISIENKKNKIDNDSRYIFVRLYNTKYKNAGAGSKFLDFGQKVTASSKWKVISNHAAISMNLQDKFYGMSVIDGDPTLKIEQCSKNHKYSQNPYSRSSVGSSSLKKGFINDESSDIENSTYGISGNITNITNSKSNKGVATYVIPDEPKPMSDYPNLNVEILQPLSSIRNRFSKKDYENYLKGEEK